MSSETDLIKEKLDIAEVVGEYVRLRRSGQHFKALCPFHQEKTPSFIVSPAKGIWHCFGCGEGGDVLSFIQKVEGLDFPAALKLLADRAGVELKTYSNTTLRQAQGKQRLFDLLALVARFYHEILMRQPAGKKAKDYLRQRGLRLKTMELFQLGYAPPAWDSLQQYLRRKQFSNEEMIAAGVVGRSSGGKLYDRFRGRIMFPITDVQGRVVAFGGRITPWHTTGNEGKYVNSPETTLYEKRRTVYNLSRAKHALQRKPTSSGARQPCLVVEGYMDVVMLVQAGYQNVVASSGTAFTSEHIQQLSRFTDTLHFAFDADSAGWRASVAATEAALAAGMKTAVVVLPAGKDPADLAVENPKALGQYLNNSQSLMSVLLRQLQAADGVASREQQLGALLPLLARVQNPIQQGEMVQEVAAALHVPESRVLALLSAELNVPADHTLPTQPSDDVKDNRHTLPDYQLLGLLILNPDVRRALFLYIEEDFFIDPDAAKLYNSLHRVAKQHPDFFTLPADQLVAHLPPDQLAAAEGARLLGEELLQIEDTAVEQEARALLRRVQRRSLLSRLSRLQQELAGMDQSPRAEALRRFQALAEQLNKVNSQS